jgi:uncharacterized membrane protein (UPF0127 family)
LNKMVLREITYFVDGEKKIIKAEICDTLIKKFVGLMFRKKSLPLLFIFNKNKTLSIDSFFCRPFRAIWLDDKFQATKIIDVETWRLYISGHGKYLLEIPFTTMNMSKQ